MGLIGLHSGMQKRSCAGKPSNEIIQTLASLEDIGVSYAIKTKALQESADLEWQRNVLRFAYF